MRILSDENFLNHATKLRGQSKEIKRSAFLVAGLGVISGMVYKDAGDQLDDLFYMLVATTDLLIAFDGDKDGGELKEGKEVKDLEKGIKELEDLVIKVHSNMDSPNIKGYLHETIRKIHDLIDYYGLHDGEEEGGYELEEDEKQMFLNDAVKEWKRNIVA